MSPDCIVITEPGRGVVEINDQFEQIAGFPRSHILGRRPSRPAWLPSREHLDFISKIGGDGRPGFRVRN